MSQEGRGSQGVDVQLQGPGGRKIGVRLRISALWIAMLFLFAYGDLFGSFQPGHIEEVTAGEISGIEITQAFLAISVYIAIASVMVS
jgi:hypothetical protein